MSAPSPIRIFDTLMAHQQSAALKAGIELDVFTAIADGAATAEAIAAKCGASERGIRILCDILTTNSLLQKSEGRYSNTPDAAIFLSRHSPACMCDMAQFLFTPEMVMSSVHDMTDCVRKGGTLLEGEGTVNPDNPMWVVFAQAMAPMTRLPAAAMAAQLPASGPLKVLDIAAGHGMFGIAVAKHNPEARITALDWAAVLEVARDNASKAGIADRFDTIPGDFFTVDLGSGYDVILITNFLHHYDKTTCETIFRKVHAALRPGGVAITLEFVPDEDRIAPPAAARFAMTMLISTAHGDAYTWAEYEAMLKRAGFATNRIQLLESQQSVIISVK